MFDLGFAEYDVGLCVAIVVGGLWFDCAYLLGCGVGLVALFCG